MMVKRKIDAYIVPSSDPYLSEYLPEYYKTREFISGFSGSSGTAVITMDKCGLWTDSRYFIQAERQLAGSEFTLYRMGTDIDFVEFLLEEVDQFGKIAFDGSCFAYKLYKELSEKMGSRMLIWDVDFISSIWKDRPNLPSEEAFILREKYSGKSCKEKLAILRQMMKIREVDYTFIGALEDVNYLFNLRGHDIKCTPVVMSYALISQSQALLFIDKSKVKSEVEAYLSENGAKILDLDSIFSNIESLKAQSSIYIDPDRTNVAIYQKIPSTVRIKKGINLTSLMKAIKNDVEIENVKKAFRKDAVALVKFFNWTEVGAKSGALSEYATTQKLLEFRKEDEDFIENSFDTISAYGANAAMPHYSPKEDESSVLEKHGLFLCDSGGHYYQGTTDITRTISMGNLSKDEMFHYTMTLKSHIMGMTAVFKEKTRGSYIDAVCRYPLAKRGLDFGHGTGHGVGYLLSVHEGPQRFSSNDNKVEIVPGMITSVEPGIYIENSHGIRIENIVLTVLKEENEFGKFYGFESLSYVPIDTRPVIKELLNKDEIEWLNDYNHRCYEELKDLLSGSDLTYLEEQTKAV